MIAIMFIKIRFRGIHEDVVNGIEVTAEDLLVVPQEDCLLLPEGFRVRQLALRQLLAQMTGV